MPNETDGPNLSDENISRTLSEWQGEDYLEGMLKGEAADDVDRLLKENDRFLADIRQHGEGCEDELTKTIPVFEVPSDAQALLDARREDYDRRYDTEDAKSTPRVSGQLGKELEKAGIKRDPPDAEEVESMEQARLAEARAASKAKHSIEIHKPKRTRSNKLRSPAQSPGIRRLPGYDRHPEK